MSGSLVTVLHTEERSIVAELRASKPFQRLEAIRRLLALYDEQPSVATGLDTPVSAEPESDRGSGSVINFATGAAPAVSSPAPAYTPAPATAAPSAMAQSGPVASSIALPGPATAPHVAAMAEAAVADVVMRSPAPMVSMETESASVVSSVRAALLGIGKG